MKIKYLISSVLFFILFVNSNLKAESILFDSKNIRIENNGNMIFATKGVANIPLNNLSISGEKFIYDKINSELTIFDNVKYVDKDKKIIIESQKLIYNEINNTILSQSQTFIEIENLYEIKSIDVLFNRSLDKISSNKFTEVNDKNENEFIFSKGFIFETIEEIITSKKAFIKDKNLNEYFFENSKLNLKINEIVGKEVEVDFLNSYFGNENNDPILKGKSVVSNNENTKIYKTVFSTCNKDNKECRGWELQSKIFTHNKIEKLFEYEKSWLKVFDKKVFYVPYFNHPDPSVKRKSGFLTPWYKGSESLGSSINIPYFYAMSDSKDMTIRPRIYSNNDYILQSEYREAFENSDLIADFSFNRNENTNTHLFANLDGKFNEKTNYEIQIQNVTNDNYLKIYNLQEHTEIIDSESTMTSFFNVKKEFDEDTSIDTSIKIYEDLSKNNNDRYQYIFPDFNFIKNISLDESYNGNFEFTSSGFQKVYETNKYEALLKNNFNFDSFDTISPQGLVMDYNFLIMNYNTYSENSTVYEKNNDHEIFGIFLLNSEYPLKKKLENSNNYLKPLVQFRHSPTNGKNISTNDKQIGFDNIFSINRIGRSDMVEKGSSLTLGLEFEKQNLSNEKILGFNLANSLKDKKNYSLPKKTKLNQTRSDIVGNFFYKYNNMINLYYDFSYDRDLHYSNYDSISTEISLDKLFTTFDYSTENHDFGDSETISNNTRYEISDEHVINFNTTKNLKDDFTQFYKFSYKYETDCLLASFNYEKKFFRNGNLVPDESLFFLIRFIPFTEIVGSANTIFEMNE